MYGIRGLAAVAILLGGAAAPLAAQATNTPATLKGLAYDSVRMRPMAGAQIAIQGTTLLTVAAADGRYAFDSIPPGKYRLVAGHPMLDSLGIRLQSPEFTVNAHDQLTLNMMTPSAAGLVKQFCPAAWIARGPAALFGRVRNADTEEPVGGARVSIAWTQDQFGGLQKIPIIRAATTGTDGTYRICGLPSSLDGKVQAALKGVTSGDVPVTFDRDILEVRNLSIASAAPIVASAQDTGHVAPRPISLAKLSGKVLNVTGEPVNGARVQVEGTTRSADSRPDGSFSLDSLPSGSQVVIARRIGFNPVEQSVELSTANPARVTMRFDQAVALLPTVTTEAQTVNGLDYVGFTQRQKMGLGFFMDPTMIARQGAQKVTDLLRMAPSISVTESGYDTYVYDQRTQGQGCVNWVVDGSPWTSMEPGDLNSFLQPSNIGAIEVYHGSETPPQFVTPGASGCAVIVIWTKWRLDRGKSKKK